MSDFSQLFVRPTLVFLATMLTLTPASGQSAKRNPNAPQSFEIVLELHAGEDTTIVGRFISVSGLDSETEVIEFREGGDTGVVRKLPGRTTYSDIVLKRGIIDAAQNELWLWRKNIVEGVSDRRDGNVILLARNGREVIRYSFFNAFPVSWKGFSVDKGGTDVAVEEIVLAVERIERVQ